MGKIATDNRSGKVEKLLPGTTKAKGEADGQEISQKELLKFVNKLGLKNYRDGIPVEKSIPKEKPLKNKKDLKNAKENPLNSKKDFKNAIEKPLKSNKDFANPKVSPRYQKNIGSNFREKKIPKSVNSNNNDDNTGSLEAKTPLIIKPREKWFNLIEIKDDDEVNDIKKISTEEVAGFRRTAIQLLDKDAHTFKSVCLDGQQRSDFLWTEKIMKSGTLPDRMAGFTIKIQDSPVHNVHCIQQLISMVKIQGKQQCLGAADTIKDLFLEDLLPEDRKLISFESRGSKLRTASKKHLIIWVFEDRLKSLYAQFIESLRRMASDTVDKLRGKAISIIHQLLAAHPEQENVLLEMLVNKLGDPIKKVGSRALFHLTKLVEEHPRMKMVVIKEVERLLFRNNISVKAQYYGICFLNSIRLENEHPQVSSKLISVYLAFFKGCVKTGDIDSKMMSGLLTGVNKAYPTAKQFGFEFKESMDTLFKIVQLSQFNISVHALCILYQLVESNKDPAAYDRFYRVLYRTLLNSEFATTAHSMQFLNLVFKSMKKDTVPNRVIAFTKRLLQICQNVQPNLACAILFLISEVSKTHEGNLVLGEVSPGETTSEVVSSQPNGEDSDSDTNVDVSSRRKNKGKIDMENLMKSSNIQLCGDDESDDQSKVVSDLPKKDSEIRLPETVEDLDQPIELKSEGEERVRTSYDPTARNPAFCGAELSIAIELTSLSHHYHPTVVLYANTLARRDKIFYDGNPLKDFTVARFLDRFVYRNAKVKKNRSEYQPKGLRSVAVNSSKYLQTDVEKVPEEEKFFYKYFKDKKRVEKEPTSDESDVESVDDEEFDDFMGNYFKSGTTIDDSDEEDDVDFAAEVQTGKKKSAKKTILEDSESDEDEDLDDDEDDNEDFVEDEDGSDDFAELDDDDDEESDINEIQSDFKLDAMESDDDMEAIDVDESMFQKGRMKRLKRSKDQDMFAPADQFADLLEDNVDDVLSGAQTLINTDKADKKQIQWEMERDRWVKGYKRSSKQHMKKLPNKKRRMM